MAPDQDQTRHLQSDMYLQSDTLPTVLHGPAEKISIGAISTKVLAGPLGPAYDILVLKASASREGSDAQHICTVSLVPSLLSYTKYGSKGSHRPRIDL